MSRERILITVKTYPTLSKSHVELVCTAGFREDGAWVRIYPVPLGTTHEWQSRAPNPWLIIGVLPLPHETQPRLF